MKSRRAAKPAEGAAPLLAERPAPSLQPGRVGDDVPKLSALDELAATIVAEVKAKVKPHQNPSETMIRSHATDVIVAHLPALKVALVAAVVASFKGE